MFIIDSLDLENRNVYSYNDKYCVYTTQSSTIEWITNNDGSICCQNSQQKANNWSEVIRRVLYTAPSKAFR